MLSIIVINVVVAAIQAVILAVALMLTGEEEFKAETLLKCFGVCVVASLFSFIPTVGGLASGIAWFACLVLVFEKSLGIALLITVVCWVIQIGLTAGLAAIAVAIGIAAGG